MDIDANYRIAAAVAAHIVNVILPADINTVERFGKITYLILDAMKEARKNDATPSDN